MAASLSALAAPQREFFHVSSASPQSMNVLTRIFEQILTPLYGSQKKALEQIGKGEDRTCFLLYEQNRPVGVIAFKTILSDEFKEFNVENSIEIKSLFVVDSSQNSGKGIGSQLFQKVEEEADRLGLGHKGFHVTVSHTKKESLVFFLRKGFKIAHAWPGKYTSDGIEYLLSRSARVAQVARPILSLAGKENKEAAPGDQKRGSQCVAYVPDAHWDDIHTLTRLTEGTFVSGSKDNSLYIWDLDGRPVRVVREVEPMGIDQQRWITAGAQLNDHYWASGDRTGEVSLWTTKGDFVRNLRFQLPRRGHISHQFNRNRINCIVAGTDPTNPTLFAGLPTQFDEFSFIANKTISSVQVHPNDWVYCLHPMKEDRMAVVVAGSLDVWGKVSGRWQKVQRVIQETSLKGKGKKERRHISCLANVGSTSHFAAGAFDGSIQLADLGQGKVVREWKAHEGKVWSIERLGGEFFASGGEDRMVQIWDVRQKEKTRSLKGEGGGVSALLRMNENRLVVGSSPLRQHEGAGLSFYDLRL